MIIVVKLLYFISLLNIFKSYVKWLIFLNNIDDLVDYIIISFINNIYVNIYMID